MKRTKQILTTISGSFAALIPLLGTCPGVACAGCGGACIAPVVSILGISVTGFFATQLWDVLQPFFIALSAILLTIAYFNIYRKPKEIDHCNSQSCTLKNKDQKKNTAFVKFLFWICVVLSIIFFSYFIYKKNSSVQVPYNKSNSNSVGMKAPYAIFDVDCLFWDAETKALNCKGRAQPYASKVFKLHDFASKNNIPVLFTTCCSAPMPDKNDMSSKGMLFIPLDSNDNQWKKNVMQSQTFYVAKNAYGNPKMNYDKKANHTFDQNQNLPILLSMMEIKDWIVFGDAFETCTTYAIDGLLAKGYKVTVLEDMISSGYSGSDSQRKEKLSELSKKGVVIAKIEDIIKD